MRPLPKPDDDPSAVYLQCISRVEDGALRAQLVAVEPLVVNAAREFDMAGIAGTLSAIGPQNNVGGISGAEMIAVYKQRMVKKTSPGRPIYDRLMSVPRYGRCPLCAHRTVSTLDHYLTKARFPVLAVVPVNLVPACFVCNFLKPDVVRNVAEMTLHPYYDNLGDEQWLNATLIEVTPPALLFSAHRAPSWDDLTFERVKNHLRTFQLDKLYSSHAAEELANIRKRLTDLFVNAGAAGVKDHLLEEAKSRRAMDANSWQSATYTALSESEWFCREGFSLVD